MADEIDDLKLGNGTSLLIFANIGSALPTSVGAALTTGQRSPTNLAIYAAAFLATTLGIVYVQVCCVFAHNKAVRPAGSVTLTARCSLLRVAPSSWPSCPAAGGFSVALLTCCGAACDTRDCHKLACQALEGRQAAAREKQMRRGPNPTRQTTNLRWPFSPREGPPSGSSK